MKKQIKIQDVKFQQHFFTTHSTGEVTEYIKYPPLHRDCYPRIKEAYFGLGVSGANKIIHICVFEKDSLVDIEVPAITFRELHIGAKFKVGKNIYTKIFDYTSDSYKMMNSSYHTYNCLNSTEVEVVE